MALSQIQLEAFIEVAKLGSFSKAAAQLNLTQSALSHRIKNLEDILETSLLVRQVGGVKLTEAGTKLLKFCRVQSQAEDEFLQELIPRKEQGKLSGTLRIGGASTLVRSVLLPAIGELLRAHPDVRLEVHRRELRDLPGLLTGGQIDFLITCGSWQIPGTVEKLLGHEENVMIEAKRKDAIRDVYLDHDSDDQTTFEFLKKSGEKNLNIKRSFLTDIYGIIDGVAEGLGRAVAPMHLIEGCTDVKIVRGFKSLRTPIYGYQMKQPYYTRLHQAVSEHIEAKIPKLLS